eukprot:CAMPEP_0202088006 /NCGR_PEP_ID=MMETSP0964-20121228/37637_1 /ASSEMBLY_ACC=CAM_ASM_000500 /TAXON_ID=4773 /ORGANISM="Schizochytrium aggregatum, Strain ATCC28209" /LENGTH=179 /DNA_ID=CAMNT_0048655999 /DNA_START=111 /DNA_END=648 /DNA_ORIENTATION=-
MARVRGITRATLADERNKQLPAGSGHCGATLQIMVAADARSTAAAAATSVLRKRFALPLDDRVQAVCKGADFVLVLRAKLADPLPWGVHAERGLACWNEAARAPVIGDVLPEGRVEHAAAVVHDAVRLFHLRLSNVHAAVHPNDALGRLARFVGLTGLVEVDPVVSDGEEHRFPLAREL